MEVDGGCEIDLESGLVGVFFCLKTSAGLGSS